MTENLVDKLIKEFSLKGPAYTRLKQRSNKLQGCNHIGYVKYGFCYNCGEHQSTVAKEAKPHE